MQRVSSALFLLALRLQAQQVEYSVTRIDPVPGAYSTVPMGMSGQGHVVGWSQFFDGSPMLQGWVWTPESGTQILPQPPGLSTWSAVDINDSGVIAGDGGFDWGQAWRYDGSYELLGVLAGDNVSTSGGINESGEVAGTSRDGLSFLIPPHAFTAAPGSGMQLAVDGAWGYFNNDAGQVVGYYYGNQPFRYTPGIGAETLPLPPGRDIGWAWSINEAGDVVGEAAQANGNGHVPWIFTDEAGVMQIGSFGGQASAADINNLRQVVGNFDSGGNKPWRWSQDTGIQYLNSAIDPGQGISLWSAVRINDDGQILCHAIDQLTFKFFPVVLTPRPPVWTDLGHALAGTHGLPSLTGTGSLAPASTVTITVSSLLGNSLCTLVVGTAQLNAPFKGGTMVPTVDVIFPMVTDAAGAASLSATMPADLLSGTQIVLQGWQADAGAVRGFAATNGLLGMTP